MVVKIIIPCFYLLKITKFSHMKTTAIPVLKIIKKNGVAAIYQNFKRQLACFGGLLVKSSVSCWNISLPEACVLSHSHPVVIGADRGFESHSQSTLNIRKTSGHF